MRERYWWEQGQGRPRGRIKKKKGGKGAVSTDITHPDLFIFPGSGGEK